MEIKAKYTAFITILRKEIVRIIRIWPQTLVPPVITITLYFVIFGKVIGKNIGVINGYNYISFIIPGLVMNAVIINAFTNTVSSFFQARFHHSVDEMTVSPTPPWIIILGYVCGGMCRGILIAILVIAISYFFVSINPAHIYFTILVVMLSAMLFSILGFINALLARNFDDTSWIPTFILTPLIYLGGVFYQLEALPPLWQKLSLLNPILYIVNSFRYGMLEISSVNPYFSLFALFILNFIAFYSALKMMKLGIGIRK